MKNCLDCGQSPGRARSGRCRHCYYRWWRQRHPLPKTGRTRPRLTPPGHEERIARYRLMKEQGLVLFEEKTP